VVVELAEDFQVMELLERQTLEVVAGGKQLQVALESSFFAGHNCTNKYKEV
jgi:hypothetical protein